MMQRKDVETLLSPYPVKYRVLEIGCGDTPMVINADEPTRIFKLDARPFTHIDFIQDASDLTNIPNESFSSVYSKDCLEHISFRKTRVTLAEWKRVLEPGGMLYLCVPSARQLAAILEDPHQPEIGREPGESNFEFFSRIAFGHQDYPENSHLAYFTEEWITTLLYEVGFSDIKILRSDVMRVELTATKPND